MNDVISAQRLEAPPRRWARWRKLAVIVALCVGGLTSVAYHELRTSATQSWLLSRYAASLSYEGSTPTMCRRPGASARPTSVRPSPSRIVYSEPSSKLTTIWSAIRAPRGHLASDGVAP